MQKHSDTPKIVGSFFISGIIFVGAYFILENNSAPNEETTAVVVNTEPVTTKETTPEAEAPVVEPVDTPTSETSTYVDGSYSADKTYRVPEGHTESISVTVTLSGDVITDLQIDTGATNGESREYQTPFDNQINGEVEGQDLDEADVSRLGGASLTSNAFNDLLDAIRNSAEA